MKYILPLIFFYSAALGQQMPTGPIQYVKDHKTVTVNEDTVTPANSTPLPVTFSGLSSISANQGTPNTTANAWPMKITDGTNITIVTASGELQTIVTSPLPAGTNNIGSLLDITGTISLPTNAAQETGGNLDSIVANQTTEIGHLANIETSAASLDTKLNTLGQKAMAASAPVVIASDQSSIPVSISGTNSVNVAQIAGTTTAVNNGTADAGTQRVAIASDNTPFSVNARGQDGAGTALTSTLVSGKQSLDVNVSQSALPSGAATAANQTTANTSLGNIDTSTAAINGKLANNYGVATGALRTAAQIGNASGVADFNYGAVGDQTIRSAAQVGNATGAADFGAGNKGAQTLRVVIATDQSTLPVTPGANTTGTFETGSISAVTTLTAPAGATGFIIQAEDTNTANLRFSSGAAASSTSGIQLQPGRSEQFELGANVSICPESGTQKYSIQWKSP